MLKYISIETVNNGKALIPISTGLFIKNFGTFMLLYYADALGQREQETYITELTLVGTGFNQQFTDNVNAAIVQSLQSDYKAKPVAVKIPSGVVVSRFEVESA
jgi:hypothetical protein